MAEAKKNKSETHMLSWNVNGIRACLKKDFEESMQKINPDIICLQETKCQADTLPEINLDYKYRFFNYANKKGYSGTAILSKVEPLNVEYGIPSDLPGHNDEGRLICAEFENYYLITVYAPNSKDGLQRLGYRTQSWEPDMRKYLLERTEKKPVILCGDLNVAHQEIDLKNPESNRRSAGFTDEEREQLNILLDEGFTDTFRFHYPDKRDEYSWWSYRTSARERNVGWRIDYFLADKRLNKRLKDAYIYQKILGSDHCPVGLMLAD
jgi:exodeoxyribonuclease III